MITDEEQVYKIEDKGDGKAVTVDIRDMSDHDLEVHLDRVDKKPWFKNLAICERSLSIQDTIYSMKTDLTWSEDRTDKYQRLIEERNLQGTLYSLQLWGIAGGSSMFRCRPLDGVGLIDILG